MVCASTTPLVTPGDVPLATSEVTRFGATDPSQRIFAIVTAAAHQHTPLNRPGCTLSGESPAGL